LADKITIKDVAKEAGVSISIVSYVLNNTEGIKITDETRTRVLKAAEELNYTANRIAQGLRTRSSKCIGIVNCLHDYRDTASMISNGVSSVANDNGYRIMTGLWSNKSEFNYLSAWEDKSVDGLIFMIPTEDFGTVDEEAHINAMRETGVPFVIVNGKTDEPDVSYINYDVYGSAKKATEYLIDLGYREITFLAGAIKDHEEKERYRGYVDAAQAAGIDIDVCLLKDLNKKLDTLKAVVANKSEIAFELVTAAEKNGMKIPEDFAVIVSNTEKFVEYLSLTSVNLMMYEIGKKAANTLINKVKGINSCGRVIGECKLEVRGSTEILKF